jgi:prophage DNA circulation protein
LEKKVDDAVAGGVSSVSLGSGSTNGVVTLSVNGTLQDTIYVPGLKGAAFLETGTTTSTVARGKHSHTASEITDFNEAVSGAVKNNTDVKNEIISAVTSSTAFTTLSGDVYTISGDVTTISGDVTTISGNVATISGDVTTISGNVATISGNVVTISGDVATLKDFKAFMSGHNTVTTLANVPITKRLVIATVSANASLSLASSGLTDGYELHIIVKNNRSSVITVSLPTASPYVAVVDSIKIASGKVGEINVISDGTSLYVRGA